jgi:protease YdgD
MRGLSRNFGAALTALGIALAGSGADAQNSRLRTLGTQNDALAWQAVGRVDIRNAGYCTGTLIAPDLVLTAAHCVFVQDTMVAPERITFQAGLTNGQAAAKRVVSQIEAHAGYKPERGVHLENVRHDLALIRLETPIPTSELDPFAVYSGTLSSGTVSVVSYGRDRSSSLSRQNECQALGQHNRLIALDCDITFGSSGAPVFTHINGRGQIASVISGSGTRNGEQISFGMSLPPLIADLKRQMYVNKSRPTAKVRRLGVGADKGASGAKFVPANGS